LFGIPLITDVHALESTRFIEAGLRKSYILWIYGLALEAVALKFSDLIITPTNESKKVLGVKFGRGLISAIPNCFWSKRFNMKSARSENKKRNQEYVIFFCANFMPGGISVIRSIPEAKRTSQVVQQLNCRGHNVKLWIAGPGSENLTEELGPFTRLGYVDDPFAYLLRSDLVILPIRDQTLGIHSRLVEAMIAGKPIVATREACCGITPYLTEAGILVCDTLQEMVDAACSVIEDSGIRKILGERNRQLADRLFSPQSVGLKLEQAYQAVLKTKQLRQLDSAEV
jgi:glycosyltransferase involved in cell wall biosynthesis